MHNLELNQTCLHSQDQECDSFSHPPADQHSQKNKQSHLCVNAGSKEHLETPGNKLSASVTTFHMSLVLGFTGVPGRLYPGRDVFRNAEVLGLGTSRFCS